MVNLQDFQKLEMIIAEIKEVTEHPNADRLYLLKVDTGSEIKQVVAGIRTSYAKEDLLGKKVVIINNLEPAVIRGETSQGMVLCASKGEQLSILQPQRDVAPGSKIR